MRPDVVVVGQLARDLVLVVDRRSVLLTKADVTAAASLIATAGWVSLQLQQPPDAALAAARLATETGGAVVLDGAPPDGVHQAELLAMARVVRADAREASLLADTKLSDVAGARRAAADILRQGPEIVALAVGDAGNYFAWRDGDLLLPLTRTRVADTTGAGDAFTADLSGPALARQLALAEQPRGNPGGG